MFRNHRFCLACAVIAALLLVFTLTQPVHAAEKPISFINDVAPILKENCFACHDAKKRSGKYDMTTIEKMIAGGSDGEPIMAGKPDESEFYTLIVTTEERRMPPRDKGEAVPKDKAEIIRKWITQGAKIDGGLNPKADLVKELRVRWTPPTPPTKYSFPTIVNTLAFTPDNKQLVVGGHHELTVWTIADAKLVKRIRTRAERAYGMVFLPNGQLVVAGGRPGQEGDVRVYDLNAKPTTTTDGIAMLNGVSDQSVLVHQLLDTDDSILCLAASADGKRLVAGGCDRAVRVWDISEGVRKAKLEQTVENHADWVLGATLSADGKFLLTAGRDKTAKVWDLKAKESVMTFPDHQNIVYSVAVKADGSAGFSVGADRQLRTWKAAGDGKQIKATGGHGDEVFKVVSHPTKPMLLTSSADKSIRSWDAEKLSSVKTFQGLNDFAYALAVSPDGTLVAGGSYAGEVTIWKIDDAAVVKSFNASPGYVAKAAKPTK
jgi:Planctomycete cytochrome C/WD domain, G-beta repeat